MTNLQRPTEQELLALKGTTVLVPDLLALFGIRFRNHQSVPMIMDALQAVGLTTIPYFATCSNRSEMLVVADNTVDTPVDDEEQSELSPGTLPQHSFKIGDLPSARDGLISVTSSAPLAQATHIMRMKNYSQIPVIDGLSDLRGVVTWRSVAAQYEKTGVLPSLYNAMVVGSLPVAEVHQELFSRLPDVSEHGYLLIRSNSGIFSGIVTSADITARFEATALPFFLIGEIEFQLRKCLGAKLTADSIRAVQPNNPQKQTGDIADLMFGDYVKLLNADQNSPVLCANADRNWQDIGWTGVDRTQFVHQLDKVRLIRNKIAHFDNEPLTPQRITDLREFAGLLKQLV